MKRQLEDILYIELKTGYSDNGPAWIGRVRYSKSGRTIYFNNNCGVCNFFKYIPEMRLWVKENACNI